MASQPPPSGIFSNVLSYVSREIECFVATAAGRDPPEHPTASTSRVQLDGARGTDADKSNIMVRSGGGGMKRSDENANENKSRARDEPRAGPFRPSRRDVDVMGHDGRVDARPAQVAGTRPRDAPRRIANANTSASTSQTQPTQMRQLLHRPPTAKPGPRKPSATMPGSLFPRSASLEPDPTPAPTRTTAARPQMRYAPTARSPLFQTLDVVEEREGETSQRLDTVLVNSPGSSANPFLVRDDDEEDEAEGSARRNVVSTSDDADRFLNERHPTPRSSPSPMAPSPGTPSVYEDVEEDDLRIRSSISKGKERAPDTSYEFLQAETSQEVRIRGKEDELQEARDEQYRREQELDPDTTLALEERELDKERIKFLEAEVARLRDELWHERSQGNISNSFIPPPPPPPPPPLPSPRRTIIPVTVSSIRKKSGPHAKFTTEAFLQSARAALRRLDPPVEAPINSVTAVPRAPMRRKSIAQPTVNVPSEKMADFLEEVRSAKLKKVSGTLAPPLVREEPASSQLARSVSATGKGRDILREMVRRKSITQLDARAGDKRKRDAVDNDEFAVPPLPVKRVAKQGSSASDTSTSSLASTSSNPFPDHGPLTLADLNNRSWPSITTTDTDLTTPSLCSDNENDHASEAGHDLPPTPPRPHRSPEPEEPEEQDDPLPEIIDVIDVDDDDPSDYEDFADTPTAGLPAAEDAFAHRQPKHPLPSQTPKKPRPPSRTQISRPPLSQALIQSQIRTPSHPSSQATSRRDEKFRAKDDSPVQAARIPVIDLYAVRARTLAERAVNQKTSGKPTNTRSPTKAADQPQEEMEEQEPEEMSAHARRRRTLDAELRRAGDHLWSSDGPEDEEMENGTFVGVGSKNNHGGFLARGGGGGAPVFMGVGYVQGAKERRQ